LCSQSVACWLRSSYHPQKITELEYAKSFESKYGAGSRSTFGGHAWDAIKIVAQALEKVGPDPADLRDEIEKSSLTGVSSVFNFTPEDHGGITKDALVLVEVKDGKWSIID